jgi:hypothetical protein
VVVVIRERDGRTLSQVFKTEAESVSFIKSRIAKGTELMADEAGSWNALHASFPMKRINHEEAYSLDGACTNGADDPVQGALARPPSVARPSTSSIERSRNSIAKPPPSR